MNAYLDTSVIVSAITIEPSSAVVLHWLQVHAADDLLISDWVVTEVSSALSIKLRRGDIDLAERATALASFNRMCVDTLTVLPVTTSQFQNAANFCDLHDLGLRGSDALHLAIAADHGATLITADRPFREAALALGVAAESP